MASPDVIELGSSDDEIEPVAKKKKPVVNAMVHFPKEVPGLVIKPVKPVLQKPPKVLGGGALSITNVTKCKVNTKAHRVKHRPVQKPVLNVPLKVPVVSPGKVTKPIQIKNNLSVNPLNWVKSNLNIRIQTPKLSLPPDIVVKRAVINQNTLPNNLPNRKRNNVKRHRPERMITTVELDDEEVPLTPATGPQWYLRPEEQTSQHDPKKEDETEDQESNVKDNAMELKNNKEPDSSNFIEITIEDSPIKPIHIRKGFEVGAELPITIEDSPVKPVKSLKETSSISDSEANENNNKEPQSKKRLDYPKDNEDSTKLGAQTNVDIELDITPGLNKYHGVENQSADMLGKSKRNIETGTILTPRRVSTVMVAEGVKDKDNINDKITSDLSLQKSDSGEFHPVYQNFIDICFELENSDDMKKIVEKKIKAYYRQCPKEYVESEEFTDMVSSKIFAMNAAPDKMYLFIKDIVDELNCKRKTAKALEVSIKENKKDSDGEKYFTAEDNEFDMKRRRQIRKLEKTIKKLHRAIQKLEEQEVEFEDEEDSVYLLTERYKERLVRVHAKFCQLTNTKMPSEPRIQIEARPGQPTGPAKRLEKWLNKKVPIGTPLPFPDFHDVLRCVRDANDEDRLGWNEADIMEEARDLFTRCGKKLQRRRQENEWRLAVSRLSNVTSLDPAEESEDLNKKLQENKNIAAKKEIEVLNKYADKQNQLKLVGEEIGDKEAEESPMESEDEEGNDESNSLENKEKRKKRLKRLLQQKSKNQSSEKEIIGSKEAIVNEEENKLEKNLEKMQCDDASSVTGPFKDNVNESNQEIIDKVEVISVDAVDNLSKESPSQSQKLEKSNDSDTYDFDSDIDELHLLQKLYSENEINSSTQDESDSDTPIAISDTLDSESDIGNVKKQQNYDIISIENSSYSESEMTKDECENSFEIVKDKRKDSLHLCETEIQGDSSVTGIIEEEEKILLASSGDERYSDTHSQDNKNDDGISLDSCNDESLENSIRSVEIPLSEETFETSKIIVTSNCEGDILNNFEEILPEQQSKQLESIVELDNSMSETISKTTKDVLKGDVSWSIENCKSVNIVSHERGIGVGCSKLEKNISEHNSVNNLSCIDKVELKITATKDINSDHQNDNFKESELVKGL